jgi:hypothetical protein
MYNIGFALSEKEYEIETVVVFPSGDYNAMKSQILNMPLDKNIENANRNFRNSKYQALTHQPTKLDADAITQRTIRGFGYNATETGTVSGAQSFNAIMIPLFIANLIKDMNKPETPAPIKMEQHNIDWVQNYFKNKWSRIDSTKKDIDKPEETSVDEMMIL